MFSISIQKYGPLLRTTDERSSADFHSGRTSDGNRCVAVARLSVRVKSKSAVDVKGIAKVPKGLRLDAEEMRSG